MSLTKEAIEHIQQFGDWKDLMAEVANLETVAPILPVPKGIDIESLETHMPNAARYRLHFSTSVIADFIEYCENNDQNGALCFVDPNAMRAEACFDMGTVEKPLHKQHRASLQLDKTAPYSELLDICGCPLSQTEASEFIEDWADFITVIDLVGKSMEPSLAAKNLRSVTIESATKMNSTVGDFSQNMSAMEEIEARAEFALPREIIFECNPYQGLGVHAFTCRCSMLLGKDKPTIKFRLVRHESKVEEMVGEFRDILVNATKTMSIHTYIGSS